MKRFHKDTRLSENFTENGLETLTGQSSHSWPRYVCKELIDNALEESGQPEITLIVQCNEDYSWAKSISVRDNGPGMTEDVIFKVFQDIDSFGGSKRHYKLPTRGNQGNALMTLLGIQYLNGGPLIVTSNDKRYMVNVTKNDLTDQYEIEINSKNVKSIHGFGVRVDVNGSYSQVEDAFIKFVELNPQASFTLKVMAGEAEPVIEQIKASDCNVSQLKLNQKTTTGKAIWFTENDFSERLKADYRVESDLPVRDFIGEFYGLGSEKKKRTVLKRADLNGVKTIADLFNTKTMKDGLVTRLFEGMKQETRAFSDRSIEKTLGSIGEKGLLYSLKNGLGLRWNGDQYLLDKVTNIIEMAKNTGQEIKADDLFTYYSKGGVMEDDKTIPYFFEMVAVPVEWRKRSKMDYYTRPSTDMTFGVNQSFLYSWPDVDLSVDIGVKNKDYHSIVQAFNDLDYCFIVVCNLTCPNVDFQDKGKQIFDSRPFRNAFETVVGLTVRKIKRDILPVLNKMNEDPEAEDYTLYGKAPNGFIKDFVYKNFMDVYNDNSCSGKYTVTLRNFYYSMRDLFMQEIDMLGYRYTRNSTPEDPEDLTLKYKTFTRVVDQYEREELRERLLYKEERGFFVEAHSNRRIHLGTAAVDKYIPDMEQYNSLLFVEKAGFYELLHEDFRLSKKYDLGIINCKGYATNATRNLLQKIREARPDIKLYTLTDLDIKGLGIAEDASKPDVLSAAREFDCIRLGITIDDIEAYNLPIEPARYKRSTLTELENSYNNGNVSKDEYIFLKAGQRVEVNALKPVELRDYLIDKFKHYGICKIRPASKESMETFKTEGIRTIKKRVVREAVGEYLLSRYFRDVNVYLQGKLPDNDAGIEIKLKELTDNQDIEMFKAVNKELDTLPEKNWRQINKDMVESKRTEVEELKHQYKENLHEKVFNALDDVNILTLLRE